MSQTKSRIELALYLDESGTFEEPSFTDDRDPEGTRLAPASQLVGILAPLRSISADAAADALRRAHNRAGLPFGDEVHGTDLRAGSEYDTLIQTLAEEARRRGWQPIRLVNRERRGYGDRAATYTSMVAELLLRIFEQKRREGHGTVSIRLVCAIVKLGEEDDGTPIFLETDAYQSRIDESLAFAAVRRGLAAESTSWRISEFKLGSGRSWRELQVCDLLSNASFRNFSKCSGATKRALCESFASYNYSLSIPEFIEHVDLLLEQGSLGLVLRSLAERLSSDDQPNQFRDAALERLNVCLGRLALLGATSRNLYLRDVLTWVEQLINLQRSFVTGENVIAWLLNEVSNRLRALLPQSPESIDWFAFALHSWALTLFNHLGRLDEANRESNTLDKLIPQVAKSWEHAELIAGSLVTQAVHQTDCFNYEEASARANAVADYYSSFSDLLCAALPNVFPHRVRSELRGKALGTRLQAEMYAALSDPTRIDEARRLSDTAIQEFAAEDDRARQFQYRSELETIAGDFKAARTYLARGLGVDQANPSHDDIAHCIQALEPNAQGFPLLHWLRLGARLALQVDASERDAFSSAFSNSKLINSRWCSDDGVPYPAHGIRRYLAVIHAKSGSAANALSALGQLRKLNAFGRGELVLVLVQIAGQIEVAGLLWEGERRYAKRLLDSSDRDRPGVRQLIGRLDLEFKEQRFVLERAVLGWLEHIVDALSEQRPPSEVRDALLSLGRKIPY